MTEEDEEFNRIEREALMRKAAVMVAITKHQWIGLTDEEIDTLAVDAGIITWVRRVYDDVDRKFYDLPLGEGMTGDAVCLHQFGRLIEAKLKEKNSAA